MKARRPRFRNPFASEAQVAELARSALEALGWRVYPETDGYDLLAFRGRGPRLFSMGIECKLDAGTATGAASVLRQIVPDLRKVIWRRRACGEMPSYDWMGPPAGPHCLMVVSSRVSPVEVLRQLGIGSAALARVETSGPCWQPVYGDWRRATAEEALAAMSAAAEQCLRRRPEAPPEEPEVLVDVPAGVPAPQTSSPWKIAAVKMMLRLRDGEPVTSADFEAAGLAISTFRQRAWIRDSGRRQGRHYVWTAGDGNVGGHLPRITPPDERWPEIAAALQAKGAPR